VTDLARIGAHGKVAEGRRSRLAGWGGWRVGRGRFQRRGVCHGRNPWIAATGRSLETILLAM
jgi:hypothetical protein